MHTLLYIHAAYGYARLTFASAFFICAATQFRHIWWWSVVVPLMLFTAGLLRSTHEFDMEGWSRSGNNLGWQQDVAIACCDAISVVVMGCFCGVSIRHSNSSAMQPFAGFLSLRKSLPGRVEPKLHILGPALAIIIHTVWSHVPVVSESSRAGTHMFS